MLNIQFPTFKPTRRVNLSYPTPKVKKGEQKRTNVLIRTSLDEDDQNPRSCGSRPTSPTAEFKRAPTSKGIEPQLHHPIGRGERLPRVLENLSNADFALAFARVARLPVANLQYDKM